MALVEFVDNQPPYLNANNLNNNFNECNNIVESGSNTNGNWIKYSDGTMICSFSRELTGNEKNFNTQYGNIYYTGSDITWTFPQQFLANTSPIVNATLFLEGGVGGGVNIRIAPTNIECKVFHYYTRLYDFDTYSASIEFIAIGKWK